MVADLASARMAPGRVRRWEARTAHLTDPDHLLQMLFALSRTQGENGPLEIFMGMSELDSRRSPEHRLAPATVQLLARRWEDFSDQYRIFAEFPELTDGSLTLFLDVAQGLNSLP